MLAGKLLGKLTVRRTSVRCDTTLRQVLKAHCESDNSRNWLHVVYKGRKEGRKEGLKKYLIFVAFLIFSSVSCNNIRQ